MQLPVDQPHPPAPPARSMGLLTFLLSSTLALISCTAPIIISGQGLAPEQQAKLHARRGITISQIATETTDGRRFVMAPGLYTLRFSSKQDLGLVDRSMASVLHALECEIDVELLAGEEVRLSGRARTGGFDESDVYSERGFHTEISLESSIKERSSRVDTSECESWIDCDHVDKTRMMPITCKSTRSDERR